MAVGIYVRKVGPGVAHRCKLIQDFRIIFLTPSTSQALSKSKGTNGPLSLKTLT